MSTTVDIKELNERIQKESSFVDLISIEMNKVIIGQKHLVESLLISLLADGHVLLEGLPGLAKTLAIKDAADMFGKLFGSDLNRRDTLGASMDATSLTKEEMLEEIKRLLNHPKIDLAEEDRMNVEYIIDKQEEVSYQKVINKLKQMI